MSKVREEDLALLNFGAQDRRALQRGCFEHIISKDHAYNDSIFSPVMDVRKGTSCVSTINYFPAISVLRMSLDLSALLTIVLPFAFLFALNKFQAAQETLSLKGFLFLIKLDLFQS